MNENINTIEFLDRITSVVPTQRQIDIQNMGYYNFICFGLNTFTKKEWGSGKVDPSVFKLTDIDTDMWVKQLKATGSKGIILTVKHHDGFCLYPSKYTDYTISSTNYKNSKGDLVYDLVESCKKYDMKFGVYLSPWDRHEKTYGTEKYNDFFCNQLEELCSNYGEIFCFWFDGACGEGPKGKKQIYDWQRYYSIIRKLQPKAVISVAGPDVRWIGNEAGKSRSSEYSVVPKSLQDFANISKASQQKEGATVMANPVKIVDDVLGSREQLLNNPLCWYPAEMDMSVTYMGWYWRPLFQNLYTRSVKNLENSYYNSVGNNAMLLLDVPPNTKGEIPKKFIKRLMKAKSRIQKRFENEVKIIEIDKKENTFKIKFEPQKISTIVLAEDVTKSQRIEHFYIKANSKTVFEGTTIGFKKICILKRAINKCDTVELIVDKCRKEPLFHKIRLYN